MSADFADPLFLRRSTFDDAVSRIQRLAVAMPDSAIPPSSPASISVGGLYPAPSPLPKRLLDPPFSLSPYFHRPAKDFDDDQETPTIIDTFSPRPFRYDLSPPSSSASSDFGSSSTHTSSLKAALVIDAFFVTRSRVVRLYNLPPSAESFLSALFNPQASSELAVHVPIPASIWELRDEYTMPNCDNIWAVFKSHEEACAALSLSGPAMSVAVALENDLEPFYKLKRFHLNPVTPSPSTSTFISHPPLDLHHPHMLRASSCHPDLSGAHSFASGTFPPKGGYTISTNPPNPRTSFRLGDWMCNNPLCSAHNFGRNINCIGCGNPRNDRITMPAQNQQPLSSGARAAPSPRFNNFVQDSSQYHISPLGRQPPAANANTNASPGQPPYSTASLPQNTVGSKPVHPLLTPSGRAFASGGRVQNISTDPMNPCIMYWPDNEPFPEQGQIRPSTSVGVPQPPIMNTGNRGPISHQPGDWICKKCNYLNWRRRKVCQTCLPYAEGNGDSISAAVQAERIALLTSVLAQTQSQRPGGMGAAPPEAARTGAGIRTAGIGPSPATGVGLAHPSRSQSLTPPQIQRRFADVSPPQTYPRTTTQRVVHRSQSHFELGEQYTYSELYTSQPIYQTSGHKTSTTTSLESHGSSSVEPVPEHLLPSSIFLDNQDPQDQAVLPPSPSLSPSATTSSSTDLSADDYESLLTGAAALSLGPLVKTPSVTSSASDNIWRLDGEESKSLSTFALPSPENVLSSVRKTSREQLRTQDAAVAAFNNMYNIRN